RVVVVTDSEKIEKTVRSFRFQGVDIQRISARDVTRVDESHSIVLNFAEDAGVPDSEIIVLALPTAPLTRSADFNAALDLFLGERYDSLLTGVICKRSVWAGD